MNNLMNHRSSTRFQALFIITSLILLSIDHDGHSQSNPTPDVTITGESSDDVFGHQVAPAGDVNNDGIKDILISAQGHDGRGKNAGRVYLFYGPVSGNISAATADAIFDGEKSEDLFGHSASSAGDVNNDGFDDILIGAHLNDARGDKTGRAYLYYGPIKGQVLPKNANVVFTGEARQDRFGKSVSPAGDVNNDGFADILIGANHNSAAGSDAGRAYLFLGPIKSRNVSASSANAIFTGERSGDSFGIAVSKAGDLNNDGFDDILVGADANGRGDRTQSGRAYLFYGPVVGTIEAAFANAIITGAAAGDRLGGALAALRDLNGDNFDDIIIGTGHAPKANGKKSANRAYIFHGPLAGNLSADAADVIFEGEQSGDRFALAVSSAGDFNLDGLPDVIIGAPFYSAPGNVIQDSGPGRAYLFQAPFKPRVAATDANRIVTGQSEGDQMGWSVALVGDQNKDTKPDVMVSAKLNNSGGTDTGQTYAYFANIADQFESDDLPSQASVINLTSGANEGIIQVHNFHKENDVDWVRVSSNEDLRIINADGKGKIKVSMFRVDQDGNISDQPCVICDIDDLTGDIVCGDIDDSSDCDCGSDCEVTENGNIRCGTFCDDWLFRISNGDPTKFGIETRYYVVADLIDGDGFFEGACTFHTQATSLPKRATLVVSLPGSNKTMATVPGRRPPSCCLDTNIEQAEPSVRLSSPSYEYIRGIGDGVFDFTADAPGFKPITLNGVKIRQEEDGEIINFEFYGNPMKYELGGSSVSIATRANIEPFGRSSIGDKLVVSIIQNRRQRDQLLIVNSRSSNGPITVTGDQVFFGGGAIGRFSGGLNGSSLEIRFNGTVTAPAVQALIRTIKFKTTATFLKTRRVHFALQIIGPVGNFYHATARDIRVVKSNPVGWWKFDGNKTCLAMDSAGNRNAVPGPDCARTNAPVRITRNAGKALQFDGKDDFVGIGRIPKNLPLQLAKSPATITAWFKQSSQWGFKEKNRWQRIIDKSNGPRAAKGYALFADPPQRRLFLSVNGSVYRSEAFSYDFNRWTHVAGVITASGFRIYVDGCLKRGTFTRGRAKLPPNFATGMRIGSMKPSGERGFKGALDDIRIFNVALAASAITSLKNEGARAGLIAHYKLDEGEGCQTVNSVLCRDSNPASLRLSCSGNNGPAWSGTDAVIGKALKFDGKNDFVGLGTRPRNHPLQLANSAATLTAWFKQSDKWGFKEENRWQRIIDKSNKGRAGGGYALSADPLERRLFINVNDSTYRSERGSYRFNRWTHVAGVITANGFKIYVNGRLKKGNFARGRAKLPPNVATGMRIGSMTSKGARGFKGLLDEIQIYNRALGQTAITALAKRPNAAAIQKMAETSPITLIKNSLAHGVSTFKDSGIVNTASATMYEDAEDLTIDGWMSYGEGEVKNLSSINGNRSIATQVEFEHDSFRLGLADGSDWDNQSEFIASFDVIMEEDAAIYFRVATSGGEKFLCYRTDPELIEITDSVACFDLGVQPSNTWQSISKDLASDLDRAFPGLQLNAVKDLFVFGNLHLDNVVLSNTQELGVLRE